MVIRLRRFVKKLQRFVIRLWRFMSERQPVVIRLQPVVMTRWPVVRVFWPFKMEHQRFVIGHPLVVMERQPVVIRLRRFVNEHRRFVIVCRLFMKRLRWFELKTARLLKRAVKPGLIAGRWCFGFLLLQNGWWGGNWSSGQSVVKVAAQDFTACCFTFFRYASSSVR